MFMRENDTISVRAVQSRGCRGSLIWPFLGFGVALCATAFAALPSARAAPSVPFLAGIHHRVTLGSMVPSNGDQNPYAIVVAPVSAGRLRKGDVLVTNFNNGGNLQGVGSTIMDYNPASKAISVFAQIDPKLPGCPGGVGLSTAMAVLKSGWVIVGSAPSTDGTMNTRGDGCLIVLDSQGHVADTLTGAMINMPWGNMALIDHGTSATLFVSNAGFNVGSPDGTPPIVHDATVLRIELSVPAGKPPSVLSEKVVGSGFGAQADKSVFLIGPTGLALDKDGTLYVSDAIANRVSAIPSASTRTDSAGTGTPVTAQGLLQRPLAMTFAPNGHLLVVNGLNGQVVEIDPASGKQVQAAWVDADKAQTPPGSGDLFGIAMTPQGNGFYYVEDDNNTLVDAE